MFITISHSNMVNRDFHNFQFLTIVVCHSFILSFCLYLSVFQSFRFLSFPFFVLVLRVRYKEITTKKEKKTNWGDGRTEKWMGRGNFALKPFFYVVLSLWNSICSLRKQTVLTDLNWTLIVANILSLSKNDVKMLSWKISFGLFCNAQRCTAV